MIVKLATGDYNSLLNKKQRVDDKIAKVQREKDLKVDTINKKYESQLERLIRKQSELGIIIDNTKQFIKNN